MHAALRHTTRAPVVRRMATEALGFKDFIRMAQVKAQYREMLRLARRYARGRAAGADVLRQVRDGYRRHRSERDGFAVAQLISGGRASLRELRALAAGAADEAGPSDEYEVGTDWPWKAEQSSPVPPRPLGLPRR